MRLVWRQFPHAVSPVPSEGSFAIAATTALGAVRVAGRLVRLPGLRPRRGRRARRRGVRLHLGARRRSQPRARRRTVGRCGDPHDRRTAHGPLPRRLGVDGQAASITVVGAPGRGRLCAVRHHRRRGGRATASRCRRQGAARHAQSRRRHHPDGQPAGRHPLPARQPRQRRAVHGEDRHTAVPGPHRRSAKFDGTRWTTLPEDTRVADGILAQRRPASTLVLRADHDQEARRPAARRPLAVATAAAWQGPIACCWADESGALFVDGGLEPGYQYQVTSADTDPRQRTTSAAPRSTAPPIPVYYDLPTSLPDEVRNLAQQTHRQGTDPVRQGAGPAGLVPQPTFKYSLTVQRGHSNDAMLNFLSIKKGYCEQFSGTFAAMARSRRPAHPCDGRLHPRDQRVPTACTTSPAVTPTPGTRCGSTDIGWVLVRPDTGPRRTGRRAAHRLAAGAGRRATARGGNVDDRRSPTPTFEPPHRSARVRRTGSSDRVEPCANTVADEPVGDGASRRLDHRRLIVSRRSPGSSPCRECSTAGPVVAQARAADRVTVGLGGNRSFVGHGRRTTSRRRDTARVRQVRRRRQSRDRRDRPPRHPRRLLTSRCRRQCGRAQRAACAARSTRPAAQRMSLITRVLDHLDPRSALGTDSPASELTRAITRRDCRRSHRDDCARCR